MPLADAAHRPLRWISLPCVGNASNSNNSNTSSNPISAAATSASGPAEKDLVLEPLLLLSKRGHVHHRHQAVDVSPAYADMLVRCAAEGVGVDSGVVGGVVSYS
jgi:hypothetical protein